VTRLATAVRESLGALGEVFANPSLRRIQLANASSIVGGWAYVVALAVFAYQENGAYAVGLLATVRWLCGGIAAPLAGVVGDRYPRVRVMITSDLVRAGVLGAMAVAVLVDASPFLVYSLAVAATLAATPFGPAQAALLPQLARSPTELTAANASAAAVDNIGSFAGPALGGLLVAAAGVETVFATAAGLYLCSALLVARLRHREQHEPASDDEDGGSLRAALAGFRTLAGVPRLRLVVGLLAAQTVVDGALDVLIVVLALETLEAGASGLGFLNSAAGVGGIAAVLVIGGVAARRRLASSLGIGIVLWGFPLALIGIWPEQAVALVLLALVGAGGTIVGVAGDTLLQRAAPPDLLARVFGAVDGVLLVALALGSLGAPFLVDTIGVRAALIVTGALLPVLAALTWTRLVAIDAAAAVPERQVELLSSSPIFAPLDPATLEALALRLQPRRVDAYEVVFAQGKAGDEYYLVDSGRLTVAVDGETISELAEGDGFGEIALLRDVPRTATVTALEETSLYALERDDFLAAVSGHAHSRAAAESLVTSRLSPAVL
jgi:MFS family permease